MAEMMAMPNTWEEFIEQFKFVDDKEVYTNGAELISVLRVKQMVEHFFLTDDDGATRNMRDKMNYLMEEARYHSQQMRILEAQMDVVRLIFGRDYRNA